MFDQEKSGAVDTQHL